MKNIFSVVMLFSFFIFSCTGDEKGMKEEKILIEKISSLRSGDTFSGDVEKSLRVYLVESTSEYTKFKYRTIYYYPTGSGCAGTNIHMEYWITVGKDGNILSIVRTQ